MDKDQIDNFVNKFVDDARKNIGNLTILRSNIAKTILDTITDKEKIDKIIDLIVIYRSTEIVILTVLDRYIYKNPDYCIINRELVNLKSMIGQISSIIRVNYTEPNYIISEIKKLII